MTNKVLFTRYDCDRDLFIKTKRAAWDLVSLPQSHHAKTNIESHTTVVNPFIS